MFHGGVAYFLRVVTMEFFPIFVTSQNTYYISAKGWVVGFFWGFFPFYRLAAWGNVGTWVYLKHFESEVPYVYPRCCGHESL